MLRSRSVLTSLWIATMGLLPAHADEGQWPPDQIAALDKAKLTGYGLELTPEALWNPEGDEKTGGLLRAAVKLSGCSAAFISPEGLIATNHHCAYRALQGQSTVESDYATNGFLARSRAEELEAKGATVRIVRRVEDVTERIRLAAAMATTDSSSSGARGETPAMDRARHRAIVRARKELVATCEKTAGARCDVAELYGGSEYRLFEYLELRDVRLVYAPPAAVGEYGGEIDNWMWPRHTGDFALLRAYVGPDGLPADHSSENVPYQPAQHLKVSAEGVAPGGFVAVLGYPGRTRRHMHAAEVTRWIDQVLPGIVSLYGEWLDILEKLAATDEAVRIKISALQKSLANRHKNARGMLDGIAHMKLGEARRAEDARLRAWADRPENLDHGGVLIDLDALSAAARGGHARASLLGMLGRAPNLVAVAIDLVRHAREQAKPDLERQDRYMKRNQARVWKDIERRLRDFDARVDAALLASLLARDAALPAKQRIAALARLAGKRTGLREAFMDVATQLFQRTALADPALVERLWKDPAALAKHRDPVLVLARQLADDIETLERAEEAREGAMARLLPRYFDMLRAVRSGPIYPDANGTLRFSYATVEGYDKWNGQTQEPQTVLAGAVAKHTGRDPFDLPEPIREHAGAARKSRWSDPALDDVPVCFLSTADTTGGNSGSPVIDGKGRLVGLNFDRVWENIAGDFAYNTDHSRNISVDIRYLLWILDVVEDADFLLAEMGIEPQQPPAAAKASAPASKTSEAPPKKVGSGCGCRADSAGSAEHGQGVALLAMLLLGVGLAFRRRRP